MRMMRGNCTAKSTRDVFTKRMRATERTKEMEQRKRNGQMQALATSTALRTNTAGQQFQRTVPARAAVPARKSTRRASTARICDVGRQESCDTTRSRNVLPTIRVVSLYLYSFGAFFLQSVPIVKSSPTLASCPYIPGWCHSRQTVPAF